MDLEVSLQFAVEMVQTLEMLWFKTRGFLWCPSLALLQLVETFLQKFTEDLERLSLRLVETSLKSLCLTVIKKWHSPPLYLELWELLDKDALLLEDFSFTNLFMTASLIEW